MWNVLLGGLSLLISIHPSHRCDATTATCPQGWMAHLGECYGLFHEKRTWGEAERDCQAHGARGHLASILDEEVTNKVASYIKSSLATDLGSVWIGLFYKGKNSPQGDWCWRDAYRMLYSNWINGLPEVSENGDYCVHLEKEEYKYWKETACYTNCAYLCKLELKYQRR
ncbi:C-type lectin mannose-binding isoform-like [Erythrolamprus reginae]|uniref:C-type lectin mannose-binding isoform-like n=1 Tax=Erythrolamprus reginae TaxID=121349 RepID=UPI00396CD827